MWGGANTWRYDGDVVTTVIETDTIPISAIVNISVTTDPINQALMSGMRGAIYHAIWAKANYDEDWTSDCAQTGQICNSSLTDLASMGEILSIQAGVDYAGFQNSLANFQSLYNAAVTEVQNMMPPPPNSLIQLYDDARTDSCLCGTQDCLNANSYYETMRIEGYQPSSTQANVIPINLYWNPTITDNWADTMTTTPPGYQPASFTDGWCLSAPDTGTAALQLWYSAAAADHLTVATSSGVAWAQANGYVLLNASLGYVYTSPTLLGTTTEPRWEYSYALVQNSLN